MWQISTLRKQFWVICYLLLSSVVASHLKPESFQCLILWQKITAFSWIMEADNGTFCLRMFKKQLKIAWSTNSWLPDFNFCLLRLVPFFSVSKSFSFVLTHVDKVFLGTLYLAAKSLLLSSFSRSLSAWHFSRSVLWVYFHFPATNIVRTNNTSTWGRDKQKNTHQYSAI